MPKRKNTHPTRAATIGLLALLTTCMVVTALLLISYPNQPGPGASATRMATQRTVHIRQGDTLWQLARRLEQLGIVHSARLWTAYMTMVTRDDELKRGQSIWVSDALTPMEVGRRLSTGLGTEIVTVTIPEGFNRFQIATRLELSGLGARQQFLSAMVDPLVLKTLAFPPASTSTKEPLPRTPEGYLFPDTYEFRTDATPAHILRWLVGTYRHRTKSWLTPQQPSYRKLVETLHWSAREITTLASIVEKEARSEEEAKRIAGVFLNRLTRSDFRPHRLQADPTVTYGCLEMHEDIPSCPKSGMRITRSMTRDSANPYNTYRHDGLPPGPISNPGLQSIRAVLEHEPHDDFYFVANGDGTHTFSQTLEQHQAAIARIRNPS